LGYDHARQNKEDFMRAIGIWLIGVAILASCNAQNSAQEAKKSGAAAASLYDGTWQGQCKKDTDADGNATSMRTSYTNTAGIVIGTETFYSDGTCSSSYLRFNLSITDEYGAPFSPIPGAIKYTYTFTKLDATFADANRAKTANDNQWFGYSNWVAGVAKNISGKKKNADGGAITVGDKKYDIVKVVGQRLYMGDYTTGDGETEATRPTALDMITYYTKQ